MVSRRDFSKILGLTLLSPIQLKAEVPDQKVEINLPAYRLRLYTGDNTRDFPVGIGKDARGRPPTPALNGFLTEKRLNMNLRYGSDYPHLGIVKGDIIRWDRTYDKEGRPYEHKMPYERMRAIQMLLYDKRIVHDRFVIHSTTDEFTIGTPTSSGCIRVGMDDMLNLYKLVAPETRDGVINKIPVTISYNVVEIEGSHAVFHADIYHKDADYVNCFREAATLAGLNPDGFDKEKVKSAYETSRDEFEIAYEEILKTLDNSWPKNFVPDAMKDRLHKKYHLYDFFT